MKNNACYLSLSVSSGGYAEIADCGFQFDGKSSFTIESWLLLNGMGNDISILKKEGQFSFDIQNGLLKLIMASGEEYESDYKLNKVNSLEWHYVAVTYDGSKVAFFIDGKLVGRTAMPIQGNVKTNPWKIGSNMDGRMRMLRVYSKALDSVQLKENLFEVTSSDGSLIVDMDFTSNPPKDLKHPTSVIKLNEKASMKLAYPAVRLKGTAYAMPANNGAVNPGGGQIDPYTIQACLYTTGIKNLQYIFTNGDVGLDSGIALFLYYNPDKSGFHLCSLRGSDTDKKHILISDTLIQPADWVNVCTSYDGEHLMLYIDGKLDKSVESGPILLAQEKGNLLIGGMLEYGRPTGKDTFQGYISHLEVWDKALPTTDIERYSKENPAFTEEHLVEFFNMNTEPLRSEVTNVPLAMCDGARFKELILTATEPFTEAHPVCANAYPTKEEEKLIAEVRSKLNLKHRTHQITVAACEICDRIGDPQEISRMLGLEVTAEQISAIREAGNRIEYGNILLDMTYHLVGTDFVLLAHYRDESVILNRCPVNTISECTLEVIKLVFIAVGGTLNILFGVKPQLGDAVINFINTRILTIPAIQAYLAEGEGITAGAIFGICQKLYSWGLIKPLIELMVTLCFWMFIRFLAKVTLTFLGVGWADTLSSLIATAATFAISYARYSKMCHLLPKVTLREIKFNHDLHQKSISALNLRLNKDKAITDPEWLMGSTLPVAYASGIASEIHIKARFRIASNKTTTIQIKADMQGNHILGAIPSFNAVFRNGDTGEIDLILSSSTLSQSKLGLYSVAWKWQYYEPKTGNWEDITKSEHDIYVTGHLPTAPWSSEASNKSKWIYAKSLEVSNKWVKGHSLAEVPSLVTQGLYHSAKLIYGMVGYTALDDGFKEVNFMLDQFLKDMGDKSSKTYSVQCSDCAVILSVLANAWGCSIYPALFYQKESGTMTLATAHLNLIGKKEWKKTDFTYHVIGIYNLNFNNETAVYDPCLALDGSSDPWEGSKHEELLPGFTQPTTKWGGLTQTKINTPYYVKDQYADRFYLNEPVKKKQVNFMQHILNTINFI